jgi:hypothetical protein
MLSRRGFDSFSSAAFFAAGEKARMRGSAGAG